MKGKFSKVWAGPDYLRAHLNILGFDTIKKNYGRCKKAGVSFGELISTLLILPLIGIGSVHGLVTYKQREPGKCGKDAYYRILANQKIDRRGFLARFVKQYLLKDELFTPSADTTKCLVFDDTDLAKTGKTIEGIPKIYDHVSRTFYLGFKLLVAGYWNGSVLIPIDFSLHRESKTSKLKYGLTAKQRKAQKNTPGCSTTVAANRFLELNKKKTDLLAQMFSRVVKRRIPVDYILWILGSQVSDC